MTIGVVVTASGSRALRSVCITAPVPLGPTARQFLSCRGLRPQAYCNSEF
jgi:hypothetical protein